jgi:hypothetical protein
MATLDLRICHLEHFKAVVDSLEALLLNNRRKSPQDSELSVGVGLSKLE